MNYNFKSLSENPPQLGDYGYITKKYSKDDIVCAQAAVVIHMTKNDVLCFMSKFGDISTDLKWQDIGTEADPEKWMKVGNSLDPNKLISWVIRNPVKRLEEIE